MTAPPLTLRRRALTTGAAYGAMFTNAGCEAEPTPDWFEPGHWQQLDKVAGTASGRGAVVMFECGERRYALRTVKQRLHQGLTQLRQQLNRIEPLPDEFEQPPLITWG